MAAPNSKSLPSKAIHGGADTLIALIEREKTKASARTQQDLEQSLHHFAQYRESSAASQACLIRRLKQAEKTAWNTKDELAKVLLVAVEAKAMTSVARTEAAEAKKDLGQIKAALGNIGITFGTDGTIQWPGERKNAVQELAVAANDGISPKIQPHIEGITLATEPVEPSSNIQEVAINWQEQCRTLEKERDGLRHTLKSEIMNYLAQILSLQAEVNPSKLLHSLPSHKGVDHVKPSKAELPEGTNVSSNPSNPLGHITPRHITPSSTHHPDTNARTLSSTEAHLDSTANESNNSNITDVGDIDNSSPLSQLRAETTSSGHGSAVASQMASNDVQSLQENDQFKRPSVSLPDHNSQLRGSEGVIAPIDDEKPALKRPIASLEAISEHHSKRNKLQHAVDESSVELPRNTIAPSCSVGGLQDGTASPA